jgi:hypothetical protein
MIRNEIDILPSFLSHIDSLFDGGCLVDHLSNDGSERLLQNFSAARPEWECHTLRTPGYAQAELSSELLQRGFKAGAGAVFFLDADEFIGGLDRLKLKTAVAELESGRLLGQLRWRNCIPDGYDAPFSLDRPAWHGDMAPHRKLVVPRWVWANFGEKLGMNRGNYSLRLPEGRMHDGVRINNAAIGEILHFPIRSREQFVRKIMTTYVAQAMGPGAQVAPHIKALFDLLATNEFTPDLLNAIAANYGLATPVGQPLSRDQICQRGLLLETPNVVVAGHAGAAPARKRA